MARIGIKLADGSFYPILEDETRQKKRLILTAARDGQTSAQIDVLRRDESSEQYVGCLVLEDLPAEGSTELELVVGLDDAGNIEARISDTAGTQYQSLSVNLETLTSAESFSLPDGDTDEAGGSLGDITGVDSLEDIGLPDFDNDDVQEAVEDALPAGNGFTADESDQFLDEPFTSEDSDDLDAEEAEPAPRPFSPLILAAIVLVGVSAAVLGAFLVFRWLQTAPLPELRAAFLLPVAWCRRGALRRG
ncbi:MAG: hypothetical protein ACOCU4_10265 [Alkalispirochaeta sp.]